MSSARLSRNRHPSSYLDLQPQKSILIDWPDSVHSYLQKSSNRTSSNDHRCESADRRLGAVHHHLLIMKRRAPASCFAPIRDHVKERRDKNNDQWRREPWCLHGRSGEDLRTAIKPLCKIYIHTARGERPVLRMAPSVRCCLTPNRAGRLYDVRYPPLTFSHRLICQDVITPRRGQRPHVTTRGLSLKPSHFRWLDTGHCFVVIPNEPSVKRQFDSGDLTGATLHGQIDSAPIAPACWPSAKSPSVFRAKVFAPNRRARSGLLSGDPQQRILFLRRKQHGQCGRHHGTRHRLSQLSLHAIHYASAARCRRLRTL